MYIIHGRLKHLLTNRVINLNLSMIQNVSVLNIPNPTQQHNIISINGTLDYGHELHIHKKSPYALIGHFTQCV